MHLALADDAFALQPGTLETIFSLALVLLLNLPLIVVSMPSERLGPVLASEDLLPVAVGATNDAHPIGRPPVGSQSKAGVRSRSAPAATAPRRQSPRDGQMSIERRIPPTIERRPSLLWRRRTPIRTSAVPATPPTAAAATGRTQLRGSRRA